MKRKFLRLVSWGAGLPLLALGIILVRFPDASRYFPKEPQRSLNRDEIGQWQYVRHLYSELAATGEAFAKWDPHEQDFWKYAIAFTAYGLPSLVMTQQESPQVVHYFLSTMIEKMKSEKVWGDWKRYGFGEDPLCKENIMYKGHLALMMGLYQLTTGTDRYAHQLTWLIETIIQDLKNTSNSPYRGIACEPDRYFAQCNAIGLMALKVYDQAFHTNFYQTYALPVLQFIKDRMIDPKTGLYLESYHPSHNLALPYVSGYATAWTVSMLHALDESFQEPIYFQWKKHMVDTYGPFAFVRETLHGGPSRIATLFGLLAAKEFGDIQLFGKLRNSIDFFGGLFLEPEQGEKRYIFADNTLLNGIVLTGKLHQGWKQILHHPWPQRSPKTIPYSSSLNSRDILSQNQASPPWKELPRSLPK